ncbi:MAG: PEP-utilizing enzyme [Patescibacteria group bacterium]
MQYIKGLTKRKLHLWTRKQWYLQAFDASPYFVHFIAEAEIQVHKERKLGGDCSVHYGFFRDGGMSWYILMRDIKRTYTAILKRAKKIPHVSRYFMELWKKDEVAFYQKCKEVKQKKLTKLNNRALMQLHDDFVEVILKRNSSSSLIDAFALGTDELVAKKIQVAYNQSKIKNTHRFTDVFSILTAPVHLSFINEAEVSLLSVALQGGREALKKHQQSYFWIHNNYVDHHVLSVDYFKKEIANLKKLKLNIKEELKRVKETPALNKKKKQEMMKKLQLSSELKAMITISEDFTKWQDDRKKAVFWTMHYMSLILGEISRRVRIPLEELKYLSPREVSKIFQEKPKVKELRERRKGCVFYWDKEGHEALSGHDADAVKEKIFGSTDVSGMNEFRGLAASTGKVVGRVKVLKSVKEVNKIQRGDILVAVMTRPDYISAMKLAAAIVTDEGGVTSHAAIISRELGIPCIIGTKIATEVLKDGDLVEVNANHGVVKKI